MAIVQGQDGNGTKSGDGRLTGLYYYYLDDDLLSSNKLSLPLQLSPIQTLSFLPFFNKNDLDVVETNLDYQYYKFNTDITNVKVYRTTPLSLKKELTSFNFNASYLNSEEIATELYPYKYYLLSDGINPPLMIKPQDMVGNKITPIVETYLTQNSKYKIYVKENRNDKNGELESIINNTSFLLPIGTNVYNNFMMTSGNTYQATNSLAFLENNKNLNQANANLNLQSEMNLVSSIGGALGGVVGMFTGNILGGASQVGSSAINYYYNMQQNNLSRQQNQENFNFKNYQIETMNLAKKNDYLNTPRTMKTLGNDSQFNLNNTKGQLMLYTFEVEEKKKLQLKEYYKRYGYKVNNYKIPSIKSKKYYNFIKTVNCNIDSEQIPYEDIQGLEQIYNSGITFWHVENDVAVGNYNVNNEDV